MSIRENGVQFDPPKVKRGFAFLALIAVLELVFSALFVLSLAQRIFAPQKAGAAPGVPQLLSYQGRLTDTAGNPLGGTGTVYCFRYSLYDAQAGGSQLWPAGVPGTSTSTVVDGVFSDQVGRADVLNYDFVSTSTVYLQVDVNTVTSTCSGTWESLTPRQQLTSSAYAQTSDAIYGNAIRTPTSTKVQIGTGAGVALGQTLFSLDVVNVPDSIGGTCNNNNGTFWYNSALGRALVCENNTINVLSNSSTTIAGIGTNASTPITAGTVVFSNSPTVTFGQNGSTITASAAGGGGGAATMLVPTFQGSTAVQTLGAMGATTGSAILVPVFVSAPLQFNLVKVLESLSYATSSVSGQETVSSYFGLYSNNANTLSLISSNSFSLGVTNSSVSATLNYPVSTATSGYLYTTVSASTTAQIHSFFGTVGSRVLGLQFGNSVSLSSGMYWLGLLERKSSSSANIGISAALVGNVVGFNAAGRVGNASTAITTNFTFRQPFMAFGPYTSTGSAGYGGTALPSSVFASGVAHTMTVYPLMTFVSTT